MPPCQYKDGCPREAENRVEATLGAQTYSRLLCAEHTRDAVLGRGFETMQDNVQRMYGPALKLKTHERKSVHSTRYKSTYRKRTGQLATTLRAAVKQDTPLNEEDVVLVCLQGFILRRGELPSVRWGFAQVLRKSVVKQVDFTDVVYRHLYFPYRMFWEREVASVVPRPLGRQSYEEGIEDKAERDAATSGRALRRPGDGQSKV